MPSATGAGRPSRDHRSVVEGIIYRYRAGIPWRDLPREEFGAWQTVWKRHARYARDGTWDRILHVILADADAAGKIDWNVSVDATICRAHQHGTNTTRWQIGLVGTPSPAIRYFDSGDSVLLGAGGVVCSG